ncbi:MAG: hypothetical protein LC808_12195 [Actinobacteria bacterium]|nr:hypothetical protein [Actinomycetota bacterium]
MAAVKGVGVSLSVQDLTVFGIEPDPSIQNTDARLFADLADWRRIVDPNPQSFAVGGAPPSSLAGRGTAGLHRLVTPCRRGLRSVS